jgi:cell division septation protein DedD
VQAGSFQMKENADDLVAVLTKAGFTPSVRQDMVKGKKYLRVLAAVGLDNGAARELLAKLQLSGFSGFIVPE